MSTAKEVRNIGVPIMLDKERILKFDLNSFAEIEEVYGDIEEAMDDLEKGSMRALRALVWAALIHEELDEDYRPKLNIRQVGAMVSFDRMEELGAALGEAMKLAQPEIKKLAGSANPTPVQGQKKAQTQVGTGQPSSMPAQ